MRWGAGSFRTSENKIRSLSSVRLLRPLSQLSEREHTLWLDWLVEYLFCRFLRPKSLSMPYSFGLILLAVSLLLQGWSEKYDRTNNQIFASMIVAKYREKPCGGDFSLHPQDLTLQAIKATAIPLPDRIWLQVFEESSPTKVQIAFCLAVLLTHNNPQRQNALCQWVQSYPLVSCDRLSFRRFVLYQYCCVRAFY